MRGVTGAGHTTGGGAHRMKLLLALFAVVMLLADALVVSAKKSAKKHTSWQLLEVEISFVSNKLNKTAGAPNQAGDSNYFVAMLLPVDKKNQVGAQVGLLTGVCAYMNAAVEDCSTQWLFSDGTIVARGPYCSGNSACYTGNSPAWGILGGTGVYESVGGQITTVKNDTTGDYLHTLVF